MEHKTDLQQDPAQASTHDSTHHDSSKVQGGTQGHSGRVTVLVSPSHSSTRPASRPIASPAPNPARWFLRSVALGGTALLSATVGAVIALTTPLPSAIAPQTSKPLSFADLWRQGLVNYQISRPINVLVMGIDLPLDLPDNSISKDVFSGRSDTMLLLHVDPENQTVSVLSIPRDTQVELLGGIEKINYANVMGGPKLAAQVVSQNLNGVTIDRYVRVSTGAFRELVDLIGGVQVFVPEDMQYVDQTQRLNIDLKQGQQTLNGAQAEQFARFRNDANGDIGRVQRQQQLIRALREKLTNPALVTRLPQAIELFHKYIDTNLSPEEMLSLVSFGLGLEQDNFRMVMLPGRFSTPEEYTASYWLMDETARDQVMQEFFDISSVAVLSQQHSFSNTRIAVQNASDDPQMGSRVAAYLQSKGFNNVYVIDDWPDHQTETQIIVQKGDLQGADTLENVLGIGHIISASTGDLESDFTLRVGNDWDARSKV